MKTIIKWTGGKTQEIKDFINHIPKTYDRYIEPFAGGLAFYFYLENKKSIVNDINFELVSLYKILNNNKKRNILIEELNIINKQRVYLNDFCENNKENLFNIFNNKKDINFFNNLKCFLKDDNLFKKLIIDSIKDKIKRIKVIETKSNINFNIDEIKNHIITALQSALYFYTRKIYNDGLVNENELVYYVANWYYVREFCYASMFRFSKSGKFNVPYGGIGYNSKDFGNKIDYLKDEKLIKLLETTEINNLDFEDLFKKYDFFNKDDFLFLDPPYDSEFSQYNKENDFDKKEQIRLRDNLLKVKCKIMVVIKETDFIYDLYKDNFFINKFDKKYLTNMNNRNNKDCQHLIITNYERL